MDNSQEMDVSREMEKKNLILIGMPGVGKSTVGVIAAKVLGFRFLDTDLEIQEKCGALLSQIIAQRGVDGFIKIENEVLSHIQAQRTIIATGGSAVYGEEAMRALKAQGKVVWLKLEFEWLHARLGDLKGRGVVLRDGQDLRSLYEEREPLYRKYADYVIDEKDLNIEETVQRLVRAAEGG